MKASIFLAAAALGIAAPAIAGPIRVTDPWLRETPPASQVGAGYAVIANSGRLADRLLDGATPVADRIEIHRMTMENGVMRMRPVEGGLAIPSNGGVTPKPGGLHLMLMELKRPLRRGETVPLTLRFARAGNVTGRFRVEAIDHKPSGGDDDGR